jgi:hypothetical protein
MAHIAGTATGASDLYDILLTFIQNNGWNVLDRATQQVDSQTFIDCVQLEGTDLSGQGHIYVHMIYREQTISDIYGIEMEGSAGYLPGSDVKQFGLNPQNSYRDVGTSTSVIVRVPLHRNPIEYWITASPRRFLGAFRHNDRWGALYCGFILPYGLPSQYPYPLWIAGNNITTNDYKTITNGCPWGASGVISGMLYCPSGKWISTPISSGPSGGRGFGMVMWPNQMASASSRILYYKPIVDKNGEETYSLQNFIFYSFNSNEYGVFGEPDGMYQCTSWGASGGDTLHFGAKEYLLLQREMSAANNTSAAIIMG